MARRAFLAAALCCSVVLAAGRADGQPAQASKPAAKPAPAGQAAPPAKVKWVPPLRGTAVIGILPPVTKMSGKEVVTRIKVKNLSSAPIALLRVDEYWYDRAGNLLPGSSERWRKPLQPGEVIEFELRTPRDPRFYQSTYKFTHAHGDVKTRRLDKFE